MDVVEIERVEALLARWGARFEEKIFTAGERAASRHRGRPAQHFAARFAAKEAVLKALVVPPNLRWHELEVCSSEAGAPTLRLDGEARLAADALGVRRTHLSLSHAGGVAVAMVVLESA